MFIEILVNIFTAIKQFLLFGIYLSLNIGKILVSIGFTVLKVVFTLFENFWNASTILHEEFLYFINDFRNELYIVFNTIQKIFNYIYSYVILIATNISNLIQIVVNCVARILNSIATVTTVPKYIFSLLYEILNNFGSGVIFLITLVPNFIKGVFDLIFELEVKILHYALNFVTTIQTFITVESIIGLIIVLSLITVGWKIRLVYVTSLLRKLIKFRRYIQLKMVRKVQRCNNCVNTDENVDVKKLKAQIHRLEEEKVCVVCQERGRSVLILPCRHFCMCDECAVRIVYGDGMCPVCRTGIRKFIENIFT